MVPVPLLLVAHAVATLYMTGLIWFVQGVHYPLAGRVGAEAFGAYQAAHMQRTGWVVGPPMLVEAATTAALLVARPDGVPAWAPWLGAGLLAVIWASTALLQVPLHQGLLGGPDPERVERLVSTNWIRTVAWTARGALAAAMLVWVLPAR